MIGIELLGPVSAMGAAESESLAGAAVSTGVPTEPVSDAEADAGADAVPDADELLAGVLDVGAALVVATTAALTSFTCAKRSDEALSSSENGMVTGEAGSNVAVNCAFSSRVSV